MKKVLALVLSVVLLCSVLPLQVFAREIKYFEFLPKITKYLEHTGGHYNEDNPDEYIYDIRFMPGDIVRITAFDNNDTDYTCVRNGQTGELEFRAENGDVITTDELHITSAQDDGDRWYYMDGEDNHHEYTIELEGEEATASLEIVKNPVTNITFMPSEQRHYRFETDGEWKTDGQGQPYFHYALQYVCAGDMLIVGKEGVDYFYDAVWSEQEQQFYFRDEDGSDRIDIGPVGIEFTDNQAENPFTVGDDNAYTVHYAGQTYPIQVVIEANPVSAIRYVPKRAKTCFFESGGSWETGDNGEAFYRYEPLRIEEGDRLYVTDSDNEETVYTARWNSFDRKMFFESDGGFTIEQDELEFYDEQYKTPFTLGDNNNYYVKYSGRTCAVPVSVVQNPVKALRYEPKTEKVYFFETNGYTDRTDSGTEYYHYNVPFCEPGDRLIVTNLQDEEITYTARPNADESALEFVNTQGEIITQEDVEAFDEQHRTPFTLGDDNCYYIRYSGFTCAVPVSIVANSVVSLSYTPKKPIVAYLNTDGFWDTDSEGTPYYYYNGIMRIGDGDILTVTDANGESTDYVSKWNSDTSEREFVSSGGEVIHGRDVGCVSEQYEHHFTLGSENYYYIEYAGKRAAVPVTVKENPVSAIRFTPANPPVIYENSGGEWKTDPDGTQWYDYPIPGFKEGDVLTVTYTESGETVAYTYSKDAQSSDWGFFDSAGNRLGEEENIYLTRQGRWSTGAEDNVYYVSFYEVKSNPIAVSIIQSNIKAIEYIQAIERVCYYQQGGEWDEDSQGMPYYRYTYHQIQEGDILRVIDAQDTVSEYTAHWDDDDWCFRFTAQDGSVIEQEELYFFDRQWKEPYEVGKNNLYYIEYAGKQATASVSICESPLKEMMYTPAGARSVYFETDGEWRTDVNGNPYFHYYYPHIQQGDMLTLIYPDDTQKVFTAQWTWDGLVFTCGEENIDYNDFEIYDTQYDSPWSLGTNDCYLSYLGQTCAMETLVVQNPVKAVEFIPAKQPCYIEYTHGYRATDAQGEEYYYYNTPGFEVGDKLKVTAPDDTVTVYTYRYIEGEYRYAFADEAGNEALDEQIYFERVNDSPWETGGQNNTYCVRYYGVASNAINVEIIQNPVKAIAYTPVKAPIYFENSNGYMAGGGFYCYDLPDKRPGDVLTLYDQNDAACAYIMTEDADGRRYFENTSGDRIDVNEVQFDSDQYSTHWSLGDHNAYTIEYNGVQTTGYVKIVKNTVKAIALVPAKPIVLEEGTGGRYIAQEQLYIYDLPLYTGDALVVTYTDDEAVKYVFDAQNKTLKSADGREIDINDVNVYTTQNMRPWTPGGDNILYMEYAGIEIKIPVQINQTFTVSTIAPTCTQWGYTLHTSPDGSMAYRTDYVSALGHDFSLMIANEQTMRTPEGSAEGLSYYYTCAHCGALSTESDSHFAPNTGTVIGVLDEATEYRKVTLMLFKGSTLIQQCSAWGGEMFRFDSLEPGEYQIKLGGAGVLGDTVTGLAVKANETLDLRLSSEASLRKLRAAVGDVNGDGLIDIADVSQLLASGVYGSNYGSEGFVSEMDLNDDWIISVEDVAIILQEDNYGTSVKTIAYQA
ncbi:MAG: dockerin type I repeat-containing protein [Clostridia bacterium]|nr:dockerin type I repeat-containing protein [Clostridia bacterium]